MGVRQWIVIFRDMSVQSLIFSEFCIFKTIFTGKEQQMIWSGVGRI